MEQEERFSKTVHDSIAAKLIKLVQIVTKEKNHKAQTNLKIEKEQNG